jgi:hypothetical protein
MIAGILFAAEDSAGRMMSAVMKSSWPFLSWSMPGCGMNTRSLIALV